MAAEIRAWSGGTTKLIHVGRDRGNLDRLDCLITTPAFPLAASPKVLTLPIAPSERIRRLLAAAEGAADRVTEERARVRHGLDGPLVRVCGR